MTAILDTHAWVKRLKDAGFTEEQAEAGVSLVTEALASRLETLTTKQDLKETEPRLEAKLKETEARLEAKLKDTEVRLEAKFKGTEADLKDEETGKLDVRLTRLEADLTWLKRLAWAILGAAVVQLLKSFGVL
jgi:hypothetical protein